MRTNPLTLALAFGATLVLAGCACHHHAMGRTPDPASVTGASLWSELTGENYAKSWKMWPGKSAFYKGREPHGMLLTTYVNGPALDTIEHKRGTLPWGSMVVKENYKPDKTLAAVTVMYKVRGYNPAVGDWFWVKYAPGGKVLKEGKVGGCIKCHGTAADNDYLFTGDIK